MSPASGRIPREVIPNAVRYVLSQKGRTIKEIESQRNKAYKGDESQEKHSGKSIWHNRQDLITLVAKKLKIHRSMWGPERTSSDFHNAIDQEIVKIRKKGLIVDWSSSKHFGIWRVVQDLHARKPEMSMDAGTPTAENNQWVYTADANLKQKFLSILTKGKKDNTYKFTLAKSLLDYCAENRGDTGHVHEIPYKYFSSKFFKYYWYQEYKFRMKQNFHVLENPRVICILNDVFGENPPGDLDLLDVADIEEAEKRILKNVFGHARSKTSLVIPKFQKIPVGRHAEEFRVFYDYDDDKQKMYLKPEAFDFLARNHGILSGAVLAEWARFLEKINHSLPRLVAKIDQTSSERGSLTMYRKMFSKQTCCFYCAGKLERGYTHVDHFIPWSYIFDDDAWNLVLACQECNCKKSNSLPKAEFRNNLIDRNKKDYHKIGDLKLSLDQLNTGKGWQREIKHHYANCREYGFNIIRLP